MQDKSDIKKSEHPQGMLFLNVVTWTPLKTVASQINYSQPHVSKLYFPSSTVLSEADTKEDFR